MRLPWTVPPPPGTTYDQLARTAVHRWWRPIVGTLFIVVCFLAGTVLLATLAMAISLLAGVPMVFDDGRVFADPLFNLGINLAVIAMGIPVVYLAAWLVQRRPPGSLSSVAFRLRWDWLGRCLLVAVAAVALGQAAEIVTMALTGLDPGLRWAGWETFLPAAVLILLLVPFQAAAEEYFFRGWVIQAFGAYLGNPWPGIILGSIAFTALHGYTDWGILYVFGFGVLMGWLAIRTGGLEAPIALHTVNNLAAFGFVAATGDLEGALEQGSLPWQTLSGTIVQFVVFLVLVVAMARRRAVRYAV
ncbi:CAAX amino protease [Thermobispora bispora]|uniref:Abortive infection protein n=1 Tax=Thermobispora bispora (strain ATCC 19993 / DSM 43833 / CBS 139.67 / JCM 10125 / KCTC 9307 / NBRC 14880 / R51) TaxID=469371 RepID=D6Y7J0_THEBD|nr:type II CAAX endopeptidase family protein [Thermobispora bispora]ADG89701.1 Abortive infection protein [Thermobispora bispora DSM 43833]MBX6169210.1 CPBP family intramembrane metalloprotease [Thermobispora bispora]MDI9580988.1 type II CAAX endopeptidase family protein [Thermobispora sp.]